MFVKARSIASNLYLRAGVATTMALASAGAFAQATTISDILDEVDLSGIGTKVGAAALVIVGVALLFKGPSLAKRVISKV